MIETIEAWSAREGRRIAREAQCLPEGIRGEYIAQRMVEAIMEFVDTPRTPGL